MGALLQVHLLRVDDLEAVRDEVAGLVAPGFVAPADARQEAVLDLLGEGLMLRSLLGVRDDDQLVLGRYGKPCLRDGNRHFNLSHDAGLVACGICDRPVGVDLARLAYNEPVVRRLFEPLGLRLDEGAAAQGLGTDGGDLPDGQGDARAWAFARTWAGLEARLKAAGTGFAAGVRRHPELLEGWHLQTVDLERCVLGCACAEPFDLELRPFDVTAALQTLR